jgi:hypothetical protein
MVWSQNHGIPVLPCGPDKGPLIDEGKAGASTDPGVIWAWWVLYPDAMIGGRADGLVVLDFDAYKPGHAEDVAGLDLPPTRTHVTPGRGGIRGRHLLYRGDRRSGKLGKNRTIDIRGGTSLDYVILPPSTSPEGSYEVSSWYPLAVAPAWLMEPHHAPVTNVEGDLPAYEDLPPTLRVMVPPLADPSDHTFALIKQAMRTGLTDGQIRTLAEQDSITTRRRNEPKRQQSGWWAEEFSRCLTRARAELAMVRVVDEPHVFEAEPPEGKETQKQKLARIADRDYELVRSSENEVFGLPRFGPRVLHALKGGVGSMRVRLAAQYEQEFGQYPSNTDLAEMVTSMEGKASAKVPVEIPMRTASYRDGLILDLGDETGRVIDIQPGHWTLTDVSPIAFRRTPLTSPLPEPVRGYKLKDTLYPALNLPAADRSLLVACVLSWLWPGISHPVIYLHGEEGTAKSTMARRLRSLVDPSIAELKRKPGRDEDWEVIVAGQSVVVLDNLSTLPEWLSDAICTAVTGTSDVKRRMYANQDLSVVSVRRSFIVTSIKSLVENGDLVDRSVVFEPSPITAFRSESALDAAWRADQPRALGAFLDLASAVLAELPSVRATWEGQERLTDFAQICQAMDQCRGTSTLAGYRQKIADGIQSSAETDPFTMHVVALSEQNWSGSAAALFATYHGLRDRGDTDWPKSPAMVGRRIERIRGILRKSGVRADKDRRKTGVVWAFSRTV